MATLMLKSQVRFLHEGRLQMGERRQVERPWQEQEQEQEQEE